MSMLEPYAGGVRVSISSARVAIGRVIAEGMYDAGEECRGASG